MKLRSCVFLICLVGVLGACQDNEEEIKPAEKVSRTVLAYIIGDNGRNDLSSLLRGNFNDMVKGMEAVNSLDCNMLVYSVMIDEAPCLIRLKKEGQKVIADTLVVYDGKENPLDKEVMKKVMSYAFDYFPADSYGYVFLSHAAGWIPATTKASRSIGAYRNTSMDIDEFRDVLSDVDKHLDFILFDACFMQSVEVAYELRDKVDYFIGSPTEIPGPGAPYDELMECFFNKGNVAFDIAKSYYKSYEGKYTGYAPASNANWTGGVSVSVIKGDVLDELAEKTEWIFSKYAKSVSVSDIMCYDLSGSKYYYDLDGVIRVLTQGNEGDYEIWRRVFEKARPYWGTTLKNYSGYTRNVFSMEGAEGISTYIPSGVNTSKNNIYYRTYDWATATGWGI